MKSNRLKHLYVEELKDLYSAENQLVKAIPKMAKASTSPDLRAGFEEHLGQTRSTSRGASGFSKRSAKFRPGRNARAWKVSSKKARN